MKTSKAARRPYWLITKYENNRMEVFTIQSDAGKVLAIFSFEEEAEMYLCLGSCGLDWKARQTSVGELISVLYGPCSGISKVALDLPVEVGGKKLGGLFEMDRNNFLEVLVGEWPSTLHLVPPGSGAPTCRDRRVDLLADHDSPVSALSNSRAL